MTSGSNTSNQLGRISEALLHSSRCPVLPPWNKTLSFLRILIWCWWNKFEIPLLRSVALNCQSYQYRFLKLNLTDRVEMYPNCVLSIIWVTISKFSISNLQSRTEIYLIDPPAHHPLLHLLLTTTSVLFGRCICIRIFCLNFQMLKNQNGATANGGVIKQDPKVTEGSRACTIMWFPPSFIGNPGSTGVVRCN